MSPVKIIEDAFNLFKKNIINIAILSLPFICLSVWIMAINSDKDVDSPILILVFVGVLLQIFSSANIINYLASQDSIKNIFKASIKNLPFLMITRLFFILGIFALAKIAVFIPSLLLLFSFIIVYCFIRVAYTDLFIILGKLTPIAAIKQSISFSKNKIIITLTILALNLPLLFLGIVKDITMPFAILVIALNFLSQIIDIALFLIYTHGQNKKEHADVGYLDI